MQEVELVHGYEVYLTRRQLDECVDGAGTSSTRLMRNLLSVFFTPDQLAMSSAMGTRRHVGLDQDILSACIREYCPALATERTHAYIYFNCRICSKQVHSV